MSNWIWIEEQQKQNQQNNNKTRHPYFKTDNPPSPVRVIVSIDRKGVCDAKAREDTDFA
jgi:hypothetical protein